MEYIKEKVNDFVSLQQKRKLKDIKPGDKIILEILGEKYRHLNKLIVKNLSKDIKLFNDLPLIINNDFNAGKELNPIGMLYNVLDFKNVFGQYKICIGSSGYKGCSIKYLYFTIDKKMINKLEELYKKEDNIKFSTCNLFLWNYNKNKNLHIRELKSVKGIIHQLL